MRASLAKLGLGAVLLAGSTVACDPDRGSASTKGNAPGDDESVGAAAQSSTVAYCLVNAHTDQGTFHFEGPRWLLASSEGLGPQSLEVRITEFVQPAVSTTTNFKPSASDISTAVGYSITKKYEVSAASSIAVDRGAFLRLEAYPDFQRTIWEILDATCNVSLGAGASYRPIGVFFKAVLTTDVCLPELGVYVVESSPDNAPTVGPGAPGPGPDQGPDQGPPDEGPSDQGSVDAGAGTAPAPAPASASAAAPDAGADAAAPDAGADAAAPDAGADAADGG